MKPSIFKQSKIAALLTAGLIFGVAQSAQAAGTTAGTTVSNQATLNYSVGTVAQTAITSTASTFLVDEKVNLTVATVAPTTITVVPGASAQVTTFTVTNNSNSTLDFNLAGTAVAGGFTPTACAAYVENGTTAGYQSAQDTATYIDELAADSSQTVYVVCNIPATATDGQTAQASLTATARGNFTGTNNAYAASAGSLGAAITQTAGADTANVDIVFADVAGTDDGSRDAAHSARETYSVATATMAITKTSVVYSDPFNGTTNPKAIPGAVVTYTITVSNTGSVAASSVSVSDSLNAEIAASRLAFLTQYNDGTTSCAAGNGIVVGTTCYTNASDADTADWNVTGTNTVTVTGLSVAAGASQTIKFQATVQ